MFREKIKWRIESHDIFMHKECVCGNQSFFGIRIYTVNTLELGFYIDRNKRRQTKKENWRRVNIHEKRCISIKKRIDCFDDCLVEFGESEKNKLNYFVPPKSAKFRILLFVWRGCDTD